MIALPPADMVLSLPRIAAALPPRRPALVRLTLASSIPRCVASPPVMVPLAVAFPVPVALTVAPRRGRTI
ncbi:hypothetical protein Q5752_006803 [Cryptotrichosporon argae]